VNILWDQGVESTARPNVAHNLSCDVAIIGAGFTGLWTAFWLKQLKPELDVVVIERERVGFGASGRNGGWASALFPASMDKIAHTYGTQQARAMQSAMFSNLALYDETLRHFHLDCDWAYGGTIQVARNSAQFARAQEEIAYWRNWGFDESYYSFLDPADSYDRFKTPHTRGAVFTPWCGRIQPRKLVNTLAGHLDNEGVKIFEGSRVTHIEPQKVRTEGAEISAQFVIDGREAWQSESDQRATVPVYSLMVATEPLTENQWNEIGISSGETFADFRNLIIYGQRTADNRIAFGGRGAPYHWGSAIKPEFDINANIHRAITAVLHELLPQTRDYAITHEWGGPLGIHRDWFPSVWWDESLGQGGAGGYVGDGVTTTFLAGRTLAALITGEQSELTTLPWVNHQSQRWEPEPLRWAGANLGLRAMTIADVEEKLTSRPSIAANLFHRFLRN